MELPKMPSLNTLNTDSSDISDESLTLPNHEDVVVKPTIISPDDTLATETKIPLAPAKGIDVVATGKGFYNQTRHREGDKFVVKSFEEIGSWMMCLDPVFEKKRQEILKNKKARK